MRELTGNWYLKKTLFGRYLVMVECVIKCEDSRDFSLSPKYVVYEPAKGEDLIKLNIKTL